MLSLRNLFLNSANTSSIDDFIISVKKIISHADRTLRCVNQLNLSQATTLLHSFSIIIYRNFQLFTCLTGRIISLLNSEPPSVRDSIKIINSCGRLHYSDSQLFKILVNFIKTNLDNIKSKDLVSILHSLTKLRYNDHELLSELSLVPLRVLNEINEISLANFSISVSKIYTHENTTKYELLNNGKKVLSQLLPEIKSRASISSSIDNVRHIVALSNMKHLLNNEEELNECIGQLMKFINPTVLYYEHSVVLLECLTTANCLEPELVEILLSNLLNKRTETNSTPELDLRILNCLKSIPPSNKAHQFLMEQILDNLSNNCKIHPRFTKQTFSLINLIKADPDPFLKNLENFVQKKGPKFDQDTISKIKETIEKSNRNWKELESSIENS
ncbi:uncharacterized protein TA15905 [Theileria annulata]|uniref:RNA-editing substrate-binding complex 6 protein domain-containing protein n=1 Tax=Theileria annulata TaxID=5874 RepID=Q4UFR2_THEAN|nr:uncharacterized protein TA15905 [Theileria annulata]CAI74054.1 hypothetical protein TA15905 [Theileria annulata]|eukprot:XP_951786.1 hypothetical protein TA15905 [Theileria annulata]